MTKFVLALAMLAMSKPADSYSTPRIGPSRDGTHVRLYSCATPLLPSAFGPLSVARAPSPWSSMEPGKIQRFSRCKVQVAVSDGDRIDIRRSSIAPWSLPASGIFLEAALRGIFEAAHDSYSSAPDSMHKLQLLTRLLSQANEERERSSEIFTSQRQGSLSVQNFKPQKKRKWKCFYGSSIEDIAYFHCDVKVSYISVYIFTIYVSYIIYKCAYVYTAIYTRTHTFTFTFRYTCMYTCKCLFVQWSIIHLQCHLSIGKQIFLNVNLDIGVHTRTCRSIGFRKIVCFIISVLLGQWLYKITRTPPRTRWHT